MARCPNCGHVFYPELEKVFKAQNAMLETLDDFKNVLASFSDDSLQETEIVREGVRTAVVPKYDYYYVHVVIYPAKDILGQWVSHCLENDLITQGNSLDHALCMTAEMLDFTMRDDLEDGKNIRERAPAPENDPDWKKYKDLSTIGREVWRSDLSDANELVLATYRLKQGDTPFLLFLFI